ncbi:MOSC domain-containing protein [Deinococcus sp.]|uniref:MOSC domain-containing protein n=1 Tax=Deinococcus sp. TaxID=47478 RepID=UPI003C7E7AC9
MTAQTGNENVAPHLLSVNIGPAQPLAHGKTTVHSGIVKTPVAGSLRLGASGFGGDEQADPVNHGGPDKAACVYPAEHLAYWATRLERPMSAAAFGENFTVSGWTEGAAVIGAVYRVGTATVQVSQPRGPCFKLAALHGVPQLAVWVRETGLSGFYLRCLEAGELSAGDEFELLTSPDHSLTVTDANRAKYGELDAALIGRLTQLPELADSWRADLERRVVLP